MGRNKQLKAKIAGHERVMEAHLTKFRTERNNVQPDELLIAGWEDETASHKKAIDRLTRRLKRDMVRMSTKTTPSLTTFERILDEVDE